MKPIVVINSLSQCEPCVGCVSGGGRFLNSTRCCTYFPFLTNYKLGKIIKLESQRPLKFLRELIAQRKNLTPLGMIPDKKYRSNFQLKKFGRSEEIICPFLESKNMSCSIWSSRSYECSHYFCEELKLGELKKEYVKASKDYFFKEEMAFSQDLVLKMGLSNKQLSLCLKLYNNETTFTDNIFDKLWGNIRSLENHYVKCYELSLKDEYLIKQEYGLHQEAEKLVELRKKIGL